MKKITNQPTEFNGFENPIWIYSIYYTDSGEHIDNYIEYDACKEDAERWAKKEGEKISIEKRYYVEISEYNKSLETFEGTIIMNKQIRIERIDNDTNINGQMIFESEINLNHIAILFYSCLELFRYEFLVDKTKTGLIKHIE